MKAVLCGFGRAGQEILSQLSLHPEFDRDRILVYTHEGAQNEQFLTFLRHGRYNFSTASINKDFDRVAAFAPDVLVSAYYRNIIRDRVLELVDFRAVNMHPSLLPDYRGTFSSVWAILNGEAETGVSYHFMTSEVDGGNILLQKRLNIAADDTAWSLYNKLIALFVANFGEAFKRLLNGDAGQAQDPDAPRRYYSRSLPHDGRLVAAETEYSYAERFVRAMYYPPFAPAIFEVDGRDVSIASTDELNTIRSAFRGES